MVIRRSDDGADDRIDDTVECEVEELARYADLQLEDGVVIIFDTQNEAAWIQSGVGRPRDSMA